MGFWYRLRVALGILFGDCCAVTWRGLQRGPGMAVITFGHGARDIRSAHYENHTEHMLANGTEIIVRGGLW